MKEDGISRLPPLRDVIKKHDLFTKKSLGQHFIFDLNITDKIAGVMGNLSKYNVIEIGPGPGALTRSILMNGAKKLVVVEKDERLKNLLSEIKYVSGERLEIIFADALEVDEEKICEAPRRIIANLPYNISTALIIKWLERINIFDSITVMVQKEVAERIASEPNTKNYGRLSVMAQWLAEIKFEFNVPPQVFIPPPKVMSSVITFMPRSKPFFPAKKEVLEKLLKAGFGQRRKMLRSSLKSICDKPEEILNKASVKPELRAEQLSIEQFCQLAQAFEGIL